jgi:hypothetical protein
MALRLPEEADPAQSAQLCVQPWRAFGSDLLEAEGVNVSGASWHLFEGTNADVRQHEEELFVCGSKCGQRLHVGVRARADFSRLAVSSGALAESYVGAIPPLLCCR